jgi:hypothetical protein
MFLMQKNIFRNPSSYFAFLQSFKSNSFLFLNAEKNILNLLCLDRDGNCLFEKKDFIKNEEIGEFIKIYYVSSKNYKTVYIGTREKHFRQKNEFSYLRSFDENFNLLAKIKLDKQPIDYDVNGENLFLLNKNEKCCTISMYNKNLETVQTFGQENSLLPFFCSLKIDHFLVSNQYFIIDEVLTNEDNDHNSVSIINRSNGLVESSFVIYEYFHQMLLYLDKFLITFDRWTCLLKCYNFNEDLLHEITLDKKFE